MWTAEAGAELKDFRVKRGWSQSRLAEELGCDQTTVSRIEQGIPPSRSVLRLIEIVRASEQAA